MTPQDFKAGRHQLGLSTNGLAKLFRVSDGRTVRRWEKEGEGGRDTPGPAVVLMIVLLKFPAVMRWLITGKRPLQR